MLIMGAKPRFQRSSTPIFSIFLMVQREGTCPRFLLAINVAFSYKSLLKIIEGSACFCPVNSLDLASQRKITKIGERDTRDEYSESLARGRDAAAGANHTLQCPEHQQPPIGGTFPLNVAISSHLTVGRSRATVKRLSCATTPSTTTTPQKYTKL